MVRVIGHGCVPTARCHRHTTTRVSAHGGLYRDPAEVDQLACRSRSPTGSENTHGIGGPLTSRAPRRSPTRLRARCSAIRPSCGAPEWPTRLCPLLRASLRRCRRLHDPELGLDEFARGASVNPLRPPRATASPRWRPVLAPPPRHATPVACPRGEVSVQLSLSFERTRTHPRHHRM
jgi:hypothetical protein